MTIDYDIYSRGGGIPMTKTIPCPDCTHASGQIDGETCRTCRGFGEVGVRPVDAEPETTSAAALLGRLGGSVRSEAKAAASIANGRKYKGRARGGEVKRAAILRLHAENMQQAEIARQVGVTRGYVNKVIKKAENRR